MDSSNIYDSVFKTMVHKTPKLLIPLINEVFGRRYEIDAPIVQFNEEHEGPLGTRISDSVFRIEDMVYHLECQSTHDASMVVRMIEYDFSIALQEALEQGAPYQMKFPSSCVLLLRHTSETPDYLEMEVEMPDSEPFRYHAKSTRRSLSAKRRSFADASSSSFPSTSCAMRRSSRAWTQNRMLQQHSSENAARYACALPTSRFCRATNFSIGR